MRLGPLAISERRADLRRRKREVPYCPACGGEFVDRVTHCPDCSVPLTRSIESSGGDGSGRTERPIWPVVIESGDPAALTIAKSVLDGAAADGVGGRHGTQLVEDLGTADVAGVDDQIRVAELGHRLWPEQAVGIGDQTDDEASCGHEPGVRRMATLSKVSGPTGR